MLTTLIDGTVTIEYSQKIVGTWARVLSSLKKLKTFCGEIGSQMVVAALRTTPLGWPGSVLL